MFGQGIPQGFAGGGPATFALRFLGISGGIKGRNAQSGGGGGAGEYLEKTSLIGELSQNYQVIVGAGNGGDTTFQTNGAQTNTFDFILSGNSGSGGDSGGGGSAVLNESAEGSLGNSGGNGFCCTPRASGGGGGAGAAGSNASSQPGNGGAGQSSDITGTSVTRGGGGGGGIKTETASSESSHGLGGAGGGGRGLYLEDKPDEYPNFEIKQFSQAGTANTGGGGGGSSDNKSEYAKNGGSGVVILRYPNTLTITVGPGLTSTTNTTGTDKVTTFTAGSDNISFA